MINESFNALRPDTRELTKRFDELRRADQRWEREARRTGTAEEVVWC